VKPAWNWLVCRRVSRHIVLCVVLGGCGFGPGAARTVDGAVGDTATDIAGDDSGGGPGNVATGCFPRWFNGPLQISMAQELTELRTAADDRDPWISEDGLRLYFARAPGPKGKSDIFQSTRASRTAMFSSGGEVPNLGTGDQEDRAALTRDEMMLALATDHNVTGGRVHIVITTRPDVRSTFGSPDERHLANVNSDASNHYDPFLTNEGRTLYLAPNSGASGRQEIKIATRPDTNSDFTAPMNVLGINDPAVSSSDPALSPDERVMVFSSQRGSSGSVDLYYATRPTSAAPFGMPAKIPVVNSDDHDGDPMLSADGCELYFASNRGGGTYHVFRAQVAK
jgi:hypothetical protein